MADKALAASGAVLTRDSMNKRLIKAQYAVRGELAIRAEELRRVCLGLSLRRPVHAAALSRALPCLSRVATGRPKDRPSLGRAAPAL